MIAFKLLLSHLIINAARRYVLAHITIKDNGCWIATTSGDGRYKHFWFLGRRYKAHVLSYLAFVGTIGRAQVVDHEQCDNPQCCNPGHLRACSQSKNMARCFAVGRGKSPFLNAGEENENQ